MGGKSGKKNELDQKDVESRKIIHAPGERKIGVKAGIWRYMGMMHVPRSCTAGRKWSKTDSSRSVWSLEKFDCAPGAKNWRKHRDLALYLIFTCTSELH